MTIVKEMPVRKSKNPEGGYSIKLPGGRHRKGNENG